MMGGMMWFGALGTLFVVILIIAAIVVLVRLLSANPQPGRMSAMQILLIVFAVIGVVAVAGAAAMFFMHAGIMVWKDLFFGFLFAGAVATLVPDWIFQAIFPSGRDPRVELQGPSRGRAKMARWAGRSVFPHGCRYRRPRVDRLGRPA